ncbi:MAG TPA: LCP family protein, partial [Thermomicrobiaceae bacterium]|nr:LCP family protein [Thermomicrobiaceae bacterium]
MPEETDVSPTGTVALPAVPATATRVPQRLSPAEVREARQAAAARGAAGHSGPAKRRWSRKRVVLVGVPLILLSAAAAFVASVLWQTHVAFDQIFVTSPPRPVVTVNALGTPVIITDPTQIARLPTPTPFPDWTGTGRVNILLLGADTNQARKASGEPALSDTIIVASIDPVAKTVGMMSIPRDTLVPIPGVGTDKINAAFSNGELSS